MTDKSTSFLSEPSAEPLLINDKRSLRSKKVVSDDEDD